MSQSDRGPGMEMGPQPIDALMTDRGIRNTDLVAASTEQLTHKMVAKARRGRALSYGVQMKILRAINSVQDAQDFSFQELFRYTGKKG